MLSSTLPRSAFQTRRPPKAPRPAWRCAEDFRRWLRKLPCAACGHQPEQGDMRNPIVAAHVDHAGGKGMGTKVADRHSVPLCDECHCVQHCKGWLTFEKGLPTQSAIALATAYWQQWPGRIAWERENGEGGR